jgi:catechol 2,3-dioxygenase-like lactoylglutathione lyase family enzyme
MTTTPAMTLGNFSVSLAVKDLEASRTFYQKLGFEAFAGDPTKNWLILRNGNATIGLFHGCSSATRSPSIRGGIARATHSPSSPTCASCSGG